MSGRSLESQNLPAATASTTRGRFASSLRATCENLAGTRRGWIFSGREDALLFLGPVALAASVWFFVLHLHVGPPIEFVRGFLLFFGVIMCDRAHTMSTLYRAYLDPEEWRLRPKVLIAAPIVCLSVFFLLHMHSSALFWTCATYFTCFHVIRQQAGWVPYAARRAGQNHRLGVMFDKACVYCAWICPFIWLHAQEDATFGWYAQNELFRLPAWTGWVAMGIFWVSAILFSLKALVLSFFGKPVIDGVMLVWLSSWASALLTVFISGYDRLILVLTFPVIHAVPYIWIVYRYERKRLTSSLETASPGVVQSNGMSKLGRPMFVLFHWFPLFYLSIVAMAFAWQNLWDVSPGKSTIYDITSGAEIGPSSLLVALFNCLLLLPTLVHNTLDGFLWRTRDNPALKDRLALHDRP